MTLNLKRVKILLNTLSVIYNSLEGMRKMGKTLRRILASVLTVVMLISAVPIGGIESLSGIFKAEAVSSLQSEDYLNRLKSKTNKDVVEYKFDDFDNDSNYEMFALVGSESSDYSWCIYGDLYYIDSNNVTKLITNMNFEEESNDYYRVSNYIIVNTVCFRKFIMVNLVPGNYTNTYVYTVVDGNCLKTNISEIGSFKFKFDEFTVGAAYIAFDALIDGTGRTLKDYYFYWDETTHSFKEYGGITVTRNQLSNISGADEIFKQMDDNDYSIKSIYFRANGIVNINFTYFNEYGIGSNDNVNLKYDYIKKKLCLLNYNDWEDNKLLQSSMGGTYSAAITSIATYPSELLDLMDWYKVDASNSLDLYKSIINQYVYLNKELEKVDLNNVANRGFEVQACNDFVDYCVFAGMQYSSDYKIYYAFYDIDKNGVEEILLCSSTSNDNSSPNVIFTYSGGKIYKLDAASYRSSLWIFNNGVVMREGSGGAHYHGWTLNKIASDGKSLESFYEFACDSSGEETVYTNYDNKVSYDEVNNVFKKYIGIEIHNSYSSSSYLVKPNWQLLKNTNLLETFSENKYIADIWLDRRGGEQTSESKLVNDILSYDSISSEIYNSLRDDEDFQKSVKAWNGMEIVFKGINKQIDKKDVYETLILDLLEKVAKSQGEEVSNIILDVVDKGGEISGTVTKYKGIADKMVKIVDNPSTMLLDTLKEWKFGPQNCESFQKFYSSLNNIDDKASIWKDNKFVKGIGTIAEISTDVSDFFERFTGYMYVINMSNEMVELLSEMYKHAETDELKTALTDIINSFKSTDYVSAMLTIDLAGDLGFDVLDAAFGEVAKAIPVYNELRAVYGAAVAFDNLLFKTSQTIDKYYLVKATYDFINSNKKSIDVLKNNYLSSNSDSDAGAYVYAVKAYHYVYEIDLESAVSFVKTTDNDGLINNIKCGAYGLWNLATGSDVKTSYQSMCESKDSIVKSLNQLFYSLDNSWKFNEKYLKTDYPEVYPVYLSDELNKDEYTPDILSCYIEKSGKTNLSWSVPSMFFDKDGNCYPLYASIWIDGIAATETVGTTVNKYDYDDIYSAPNPMKLYNYSNFSTFSKKYNIAAYSTTDSGKVYTKSTSYTLENPLKKANISLSVGGGSLSTLGKGITISISDPTSSLYPFVKYNIYRKTNDSSWSLLETIDKDTQIRGMRTFFCDDTVHSGNKYSYKIVSSLTFENGVTLESEESNILTVGSKSETPDVSDVRFERFNKTVAFPVSYSAQTRAVSSDLNKAQNCIKLTWNKIEGAEQYEIYRKVSFGSLYNLIGTVSGDTLTYIDETTEECCEYSYYVVPCKSSGSNEKIYDITGYATGEIDNKSLGDVNEDSKINSTDALLILQHATGLITLSESKKLNADVTWDGKINSSDALRVLQYSTGLVTSF